MKSFPDYINELIKLADHDVLDIMRSRTVEQEVLDILDESENRKTPNLRPK